MFQTGELVVYGINGVCRVEDVVEMSAPGGKEKHKYYTLMPIYHKGSKVFAPVDGHRIPMRPVMTDSEARTLLKEADDLEELSVPDEKHREETYRNAIKTCDCREWLKMIKTLHERMEERIARGRKVPANDEKYFHLAEDNLFGELAVALSMERDKVSEYFANSMKHTAH